MALTACPHCGHESEAEVCPLCGSEMPRDGAGPVRSGPGGTPASTASAAPPDGSRRVAWEDPAVAFPANAWRSWRKSLLEPTAFFRRIDHGAPLVRPVLYFLLVSLGGAFFNLLWQAYLYMPMAGESAAYGGGFYVVQFFATPFVVLFFLAVQALVMHLFVLMLAPDRRGVGSTARVICYASGPALLSVVPFLGALAAAAWGLVLNVIGVREVHRTSTGRAVVIALGPLILVFGAVVLLVVLVALAASPGELASGPPGHLPLPVP